MYFGNGIYCTALKQAKDSTVYSYEFSFNGTANIIKKFSDGEDFPGIIIKKKHAYPVLNLLLTSSMATY